jgi:hypothetical protein
VSFFKTFGNYRLVEKFYALPVPQKNTWSNKYAGFVERSIFPLNHREAMALVPFVKDNFLAILLLLISITTHSQGASFGKEVHFCSISGNICHWNAPRGDFLQSIWANPVACLLLIEPCSRENGLNQLERSRRLRTVMTPNGK